MSTTQYSIRTVKQFKYRGDPLKQFSNRYYFDGSAPADQAAWTALSDALVLLEKTLFYATVSIVATHGIGPSSEVPVFNKIYTTTGTLNPGTTAQCPGDCAVMLRHATTKKSTKNHVVYCFSYYHAVFSQDAGANCDAVAPPQITAVQNFGNAWNAGIAVGARTYKRCTPDGHLVTGAAVDPWIRHRDFPA